MALMDFINTRSLVLCYLSLLILLTVACNSGGGGDTTNVVPEPVGDSCNSTSFSDNGGCVTFATRSDERMSTSFFENGQPVTLEVLLFKPLEGTRFPTIVFHHGSTGNGSNPALFTQTFYSKSVARFFVERGWMVAFPQRRGRGASDGLYDEGFTPDRSSYSCALATTLAGAERALEDLEEITNWLQGRTDVDTTRMLVSGTSRGGILSIAHVARRPEVYLAAINFVGGWLGEGCGDYLAANEQLFVAGSGFTGRSLWLYGENDSFYSLSHSQNNFGAFTAAGGNGEFHIFTRAAGLNGHFIVNDPELWEVTVDNFIN